MNQQSGAQMTRLYYSREDRINELHEDKERVQYDGGDDERVAEVMDTFDEFSENLGNALEGYLIEMNTPIDEDSESRMRYARQNIVERWALAQGALSKVAWVLRIDGNTAYENMINAVKFDQPMDMRGL